MENPPTQTRRGNVHLKFKSLPPQGRWHGVAVTDEGHLPLPMGEVPRRGGEGIFTLSVSFADSSPKVGAKENEGNGLPHQRARWFAMTLFYLSTFDKPAHSKPKDSGAVR